MTKIQKHKGFTLIELIVVIAVLAIIAALALPAFNSLREDAKEKICYDNMATVERVWLIDAATQNDAIVPADMMALVAAEMQATVKGADTLTGLCPDADGEYTLVPSADTGNHALASITCSKHGQDGGTVAGNMENFAQELRNPTSELRKYLDSIKIKTNSSIDYPLPEGNGQLAGWSNEVVKLAAKQGIDLSKCAWRVYHWGDGDGQHYSLYYTEDDLTKLKVGDKIDVTRWEIGGDKDNQAFTGQTAVEKHKTYDYNIIHEAKIGELKPKE